MKLVNVVKRLRYKKDLEQTIKKFAPVLLTEQGIELMEQFINQGLITKQEKVYFDIKVQTKILCLMLEKQLEDQGYHFVSQVAFLDKSKRDYNSFGEYVHISGPNLPDEYIEALDGIRLQTFSGPCGRSVYSKKVASLYDIDSDPLEDELRPILKSFGINTIHSFPINVASEVIGTFVIFSRNKQTFMEAEKVIEFAKNYLTNYETLLAALQERWNKRYLETWHGIVDYDGVIRFKEESIKDIMGYDPGELIGSGTFLDYVYPTQRDYAWRVFEEVRNKKQIKRMCMDVLDKQGVYQPLDTLWIPIYEGEKLRYIEVILSYDPSKNQAYSYQPNKNVR